MFHIRSVRLESGGRCMVPKGNVVTPLLEKSSVSQKPMIPLNLQKSSFRASQSIHIEGGLLNKYFLDIGYASGKIKNFPRGRLSTRLGNLGKFWYHFHNRFLKTEYFFLSEIIYSTVLRELPISMMRTVFSINFIQKFLPSSYIEVTKI